MSAIKVTFEQADDDVDVIIAYADGAPVGQVEVVCGEWFARPIGADDYAEQSFKGKQTAGEWLARTYARNSVAEMFTSGQTNVPTVPTVPTMSPTVASLWERVTGGIGRGGYVIMPTVPTVPTVADVDDAPEVKIGAKVNGANSGAKVWSGARSGRTRCEACNGRSVPATAGGMTASHKIVKHHGYMPTMVDGSEAQRCDGARRKSASTGVWETIPMT